MFTGNLDDVKRDLELLYSLEVNKKVRQILVRRMDRYQPTETKRTFFSMYQTL